MNEINRAPALEAPQPLSPAPDGDIVQPPPAKPGRPSQARGWLVGFGVLVLFSGTLAEGVWRHYTQHLQVVQTAEQQASFVPNVRVDEVERRYGDVDVTLPGTTLAFEQANIYARASGYVLKRFVDIGDHVKAGQLLAEITAPEVEEQVAQYQNGLAQALATLHQNEANRALAQVTNARFGRLTKDGWVSEQLGDTDRYNYQAQQSAMEASQYNAGSVQSQLKYYAQQKAYQQVTAPFDGVITQRNIDIGSLITADATSGTAMFSMVHSNVIRVWVYVPQDDAFGVSPGVDATVRVPNMPNLTFRGKVTRIADALQPGTRTLLTEVDVPNPENTLTPGIYCTVELQIPRTSPALIVPASAIIFNQNGMQVAVVNSVASPIFTRSQLPRTSAPKSRSARVSTTARRSSCNRR